MLVVASIGSNCGQDARAQLPNQFTQEFRVAPVKSLEVDWISDRSIPLAVRLEWPICSAQQRAKVHLHVRYSAVTLRRCWG